MWLVPVTTASDTSAGVSHLSAASFHCTLYPVTAEPPSEAGASQDTDRDPLASRATSGRPGAPGAWAACAAVSFVTLSSVKEAAAFPAESRRRSADSPDGAA